MRLNFKKVSAIATSALMVGLTMGTAVAANYPAPFVMGGSADVAVVYGTGSGVSSLDLVQAGNIQSNLQSYMGASSGGSTVATSGETAALDTSADRIWLNTSLNAVKSTLTKSDLPTVLADSSFAGDQTATLTPTIKLIAGGTAGGDNSGKVIFSKQPKSTNDPVIVLNPSTRTGSSPLYNVSVTFSKAINFTHADSEGEELVLFGQSFTVASETDTSELVLLKQAEKVELSSDSPSVPVTVGDTTYTVELVSASDTAATIKVTDSTGASSSKEVNEAASKRIQGVDVAVITADETNLKLSASVVVGTDKITLGESGGTVTSGESDDPIDGTTAYIIGGTDAVTELAVTVYAPDTSSDAILPGEAFVDPVFGSFKLDFAGLSSSLDDANREEIAIQNSGDKAMSLTMTDQDGNSGTFEFAYNASYGSSQVHTGNVSKPANWRLSDDANFSIYVYEGANLSEDEYIVLGNEDYGHLLQVTQIYNDSSSTFGNDKVKFRDVLSGTSYETVFTSSGVGTVTIDGKQYTVLFDQTYGSIVTVKYPTSESADANTWVLYPTIETESGALVQLYEPLNISLNAFNGTVSAGPVTFRLPDGDSYTDVVLTYVDSGAYGNWSMTVGGTAVNSIQTTAAADAAVGANSTAFTIGTMTWNVSNAGAPNRTMIQLNNPESTAAGLEAEGLFGAPGVVIYEGKDDDSNYHGVLVNLEDDMAGTSTDGAGVNDVLFSSDKYHASATLHSDSDVTQDIDWWGTLVTTNADDSDQKTVEIMYPKSQVYANLYIGAVGSSVIGGSVGGGSTQLGDILVKDSEVSSVSSKNLIVVGGSCINSVAANLLGSGCGSDFTDKTGIGSGQFLIQSMASPYSSSKVALVVAGYEAADTVNAATFLRTQTVDTMTGKKYKGTSSTSAEQVVESA
jgi:hypothetical protein